MNIVIFLKTVVAKSILTIVLSSVLVCLIGWLIIKLFEHIDKIGK